MTRDELGRVARAAESAAWVASGGGEPDDWDHLDAESQEGYCVMAEAVRAAVIAAEFGPQSSVVVTEYLTALERLARANMEVWRLTPRSSLQTYEMPLPTLLRAQDRAVKERESALAALRDAPDWQRKGDPS